MDERFHPLLVPFRWLQSPGSSPYTLVHDPLRDKYDTLYRTNRKAYKHLFLHRAVFMLGQGVGTRIVNGRAELDVTTLIDTSRLIQRLSMIDGDWLNCTLENIDSIISPRAYQAKEKRDLSVLQQRLDENRPCDMTPEEMRLELEGFATGRLIAGPDGRAIPREQARLDVANESQHTLSSMDDLTDENDPSLAISPTTPASQEKILPQAGTLREKNTLPTGSIMSRPTDVGRLLAPLENIRDDSMVNTPPQSTPTPPNPKED
jgi:hypothetical protein